MTREDYCSYEVAKLLKEKGFKCGATYSKGFVKDGDGFVGGLVRHEDKITHQMAMKWMREKDIDIIIMPLFKLKEGRIYCYEIHSDNTDVRVGRFETYEEAVEAAIKYSLENLI